MLEAIRVDEDSSFKVATYDNESYCESAGWHIHPEYELVYIKNGSGSLHIGSKTRNYSNGCLVFLAGNIPHADFGNKDNPNNIEVVIQFKKELVEEKLKAFPEFKSLNTFIEQSARVLLFDNKVKDSLSINFESFRFQDNPARLINLLEILSTLEKSVSYDWLFDTFSMNQLKSDEVKRLEEIFEYVNSNYQKEVNIAEISSQLGLTPNSFSRFFKKMTNRRFMDFVNSFRISRAVEMFNATNPAISDVMYRTGFNDPSYFSKQFKKYQGESPSNYVKRKYQPLLV